MTAQNTARPLRMLALVAAPLVLHQSDGHTVPIQPLNAARGLAAALLDLGVSHVVAINADDAILDAAARAFARSFYNVLLSGRSVREAFDRAVQAVRSDDTLRALLDPQTLAPVNLTEAIKFR